MCIRNVLCIADALKWMIPLIPVIPLITMIGLKYACNVLCIVLVHTIYTLFIYGYSFRHTSKHTQQTYTYNMNTQHTCTYTDAHTCTRHTHMHTYITTNMDTQHTCTYTDAYTYTRHTHRDTMHNTHTYTEPP